MIKYCSFHHFCDLTFSVCIASQLASTPSEASSIISSISCSLTELETLSESDIASDKSKTGSSFVDKRLKRTNKRKGIPTCGQALSNRLFIKAY